MVIIYQMSGPPKWRNCAGVRFAVDLEYASKQQYWKLFNSSLWKYIAYLLWTCLQCCLTGMHAIYIYHICLESRVFLGRVTQVPRIHSGSPMSINENWFSMNLFSAWHRFHAWGCNLLGTSVDPQTRKRVQELWSAVDCRRTSRLQRMNNDILFFKVQSLYRQLDVSSWNKSKVECGHLPLLTCQGFRHAELWGSHVLQCRDLVSHCYRQSAAQHNITMQSEAVWRVSISFGHGHVTCIAQHHEETSRIR